MELDAPPRRFYGLTPEQIARREQAKPAVKRIALRMAHARTLVEFARWERAVERLSAWVKAV